MRNRKELPVKRQERRVIIGGLEIGGDCPLVAGLAHVGIARAGFQRQRGGEADRRIDERRQVALALVQIGGSCE